jgi:hypothetical protein
MGAPYRTVRVHPVVLRDRTVLAVEPEDQRGFEFGERVYAVRVDEGQEATERVGIVTWDPVARWIVTLEQPGERVVPW